MSIISLNNLPTNYGRVTAEIIASKVLLDTLNPSLSKIKQEVVAKNETFPVLKGDDLKDIADKIFIQQKDTFNQSQNTVVTRNNPSSPPSTANNGLSWSYRQITSYDGSDISMEDFRAKVEGLNNPVTNKPYVESYKKFNLEKRVGLGVTDETIGNLPPYYSNFPLGGTNDTKLFDSRISPTDVTNPTTDYLRQQTRDLVRFRIQTIDNNNPNFGNYLVFRANLTGISDSYSPEHNSFSYMGRGESFYTYQKTDRTISLTFKIYSHTKQEMKVMYQKLNTLASSTYGDYYKNKLRGSFHKITIGDYLENQPCLISSLTYTIPDESAWVIALDTQNGSDEGISNDEYTLPMMIEVSMSLKVIHNFLPKKSLSDSFFVLPNEKIKDTKSNRKWIVGDMAILENSIISNKTSTKTPQSSNSKTIADTLNQNKRDFNMVSIQNANDYRTA
jgi:hypothetical protein